MKLFPYTQSVLTSLGLMACGLALVIGLGVQDVAHSFTLQPSSVLDHFAVTGILFIIMGFSLFGFTLVLHATGVRYGNSPASSPSQND